MQCLTNIWEVLVNQAGGGVLLENISSDEAFYSTQITKYYDNIKQSHEWLLANSKAEIKINKQLQNLFVASCNWENTNSSNERQEN